jgi:hypothetical protein
MPHTYLTVDEEYIKCTRKGCTDIGVYNLKIIFVNRWAYFCAKHKKELEECGLIESNIGLKTREVSK